LKKWEEMDIYHKQLKKNAGKPKFVLHDGPLTQTAEFIWELL